MEVEEERETSGVPVLTMKNWNAEFKEAFLNYALLFGEAGEILQNGEDIVREKPDFNEVVVRLTQDGEAGEAENAVRRKYPEDQVGYRLFERDEKKYESLKEGKKKLLSRLVSKMSREVKTKVSTNPRFKDAYKRLDILSIWNMVQDVVLGGGAVSVYQLTLRLLKMKQEGENYTSYAKDFTEAVEDLMRQGDAETILKKILNTLFILGLNQLQFRDKLNPIYGSNEWPDHQDLSAELHTYSEARRTVSALNGEELEGKVSANATNVEGGCFNCGSTEHMKRDCPKEPSHCRTCGRVGHLPQYCRNKPSPRGDAPRDHRRDGRPKEARGGMPRKDAGGGMPRNGARGGMPSRNSKGGGMPQKGRKAFQKKAEGIREAIGMLASQLNEMEDEFEEELGLDHDPDPYQDQGQDDYDDDDDEYPVSGMMTSLRDIINRALITNEKTVELLIDSACNGAHVLKSEAKSLVTDAVPSSKKLYGIGGAALTSETRGNVGNVGRALVVPHAEANLLSLMEVVSSINGSFQGNTEVFEILNADGDVILTGVNNGDGFWKCTLEDVQKIACLLGHADDADSDSEINEPPPGSTPPAFTPPVIKHYTSEDLKRAGEARDLCALLGHPGSDALIKGLDNGNYVTHLTAQDVRNAIAIHGKCIACIEGKMKADPTPKESKNPPAPSVGHTLHCDIIPLRHVTIGGNKFLLFAIDEKSAYISLTAMANKSAKTLCDAFDGTIAEYVSYGHTVYKVQTDHESNLICCKTHLNGKGVEYTALPANHHEKIAERSIQTLRTRAECCKMALTYELPDKLEAECFFAAQKGMNRTVRKRSAPYTPTELVTHRKAVIPRFSFGQVGVFYKRRKDTTTRTEWGIFLSQGEAPRDLRAYLPMRDGVYSMMKFTPVATVPSEWNFRPRIHRHLPAPKPAVPTAAPPPAMTPAMSPVAPPPMPQMIADQEGRSGRAATAALPNAPPPSVAQSPDRPTRVPTTHVPAVHHSPVPPPVAPPRAAPPVVPDAPAAPHTAQEGTSPARQERMAQAAQEGTAQEGIRNATAASPVPASPAVPLPPPEPPPVTSRPVRGARQQTWKDGPAKSRRAYTAHMARIFNDPHGPLAVLAYRMSLKQALQDPTRRMSTLQAAEAEIHSMENGDVSIMVHYRDIARDKRHLIVPAHMFIKDKHKADGSFDKTKARLVANGDRQHPDSVGETFSPTVNQISVFSLLNIAAANGSELSAYDIKSAFLVTPVDRTKKEIYLRIPREVAALWIRLYPERAQYLDSNGCLYVLLNKFIYGLQEASHEFHALLRKKLLTMGFKPTRADRCVFVKHTPQGIIAASTHVDDILLVSPNPKLRTWFETELQKSFEIVCQRDNISYLGMNIVYDRDKRTIEVSQSGAIRELVKKYGCDNLRKHPTTPATAALFQESADRTPCDKKEFLSLVMSMMYIARLTRFDILMPVTALATRSADPCLTDMTHLRRIIRYLAGTTDVTIVFDGNAPLKPVIYADASHGVYPDGRGHGGIFITLGSAPILGRSFKIKAVTRSTSESELYVLEEASTYAGWLKLLLSELAVDAEEPIPTYQDNKSTMIIAMQGGNFKRTKHLLVRESYVKERVDAGDIVLLYLATEDMPPDMLTKPLAELHLTRHMAAIGMRL